MVVGIVSGLVMGISLFIVGAIASRLVYGPQFVPEGKFEPEQINAWYFFWTKIVIGIFFGLLFTFIYAKVQVMVPWRGILRGLLYALFMWLVICLWSISHPFTYDFATAFATRDQLFWHIYSLGGFLGYGATVGLMSRGSDRPKHITAEQG
jgi:hypothetical protein